MRKISAGLPLRVLAGIGIVACLALSGGASAATAPTANATTARTVTAVAPAGAAVVGAYTSAPGWLTSVSVVSANNAWAVGVDAVKGGLIFHWNGKRWSYLNLAGYFNGVAARSATDVWAVGATSQFSDSQPLAVHWNGRSWTRVPTPALKIGGYFNAVAGSSASSVWAVGLVGPGRGVTAAAQLIEHWNGRRWTVQKFPALPGGGQFSGVAASWANNIWAVGTAYGAPGCIGESCGPFLTLIMHWNGSRWKVVPSPNPEETISIALNGVAAVARDNIWAVGNANSSSTFIVHWNGRAWS